MGKTLQGKSTFPIRVLARLATAGKTAERNAARLDEITPASVRKEYASLIGAAVNSKRNKAVKIQMLWQAADLLGKHIQKVAACQKGCSHCCHIAVAVSPAEADLIGKQIKRKPNPVSPRMSDLASLGLGEPCLFLKNGACSIYENRPLACRTQYNMDEDALLCELVEGEEIPVPYIDSRSITMAYAMICQEGVATLREFFEIPTKTTS